MSVAITDRIRRGQSTAAPFAVAWEEDLKTSSVTVATLSDRDTIPEWKRMGYMTCFVIATGLEYQLGSDTTVAGQVWTARTYGVPANVLVHDDILDVNNHILPQLIQNIFLNTSYVVASQAAMLALTSFTGNFFIRTDLGQVFIKLNNTNPAAIGDFATSVTPSVISVNGQTGVVSITIANLLAVGANLTAFNTAVSSNTTVAANSAGIVTLNSAVATLTSSVSNLNSYVLSHLGTKNLSALMTSPGPVQNGYLVKWDNLNNRFDLISPTAGVGGGAVNFVNLLDVPTSYTGQSLRVVRVNAAETALEFFSGGAPPFQDNAAIIKNFADPTKLVIFSAASITTATTRTYTLPDVTDTLVTLSSAGALSNKTGLISQWTNDSGYALAANAWLLASGGVLTGNNTISGAFTVSFQNTATSSTVAITPTVSYGAAGFAFGIAPTASVSSAGSATSHLLFGNTTTFGGASTKHIMIQFGNTINNNSQATTTLTGISYNPTLNNTTGLTHYAALFNKGLFGIGTLTPTSLFEVVAPVQTAAWNNLIKFTPAAHTGLTASAEFLGLNSSISAVTQQWGTGTLATQRWNYINSPTIAFVAASTLTNGYNFYIEPLVAGTNATITNNYALGVAGQTYIFNNGSSGLTAQVLDINNASGSVWQRLTTGGRAAEYGRWQSGSNSVDYVGGQFRMNFTGVNSNWTQSNNPTGWEPAFTWQAGTHTAITLSTEKPMFTVGTFTQQWATGALTIQRNFWIKAPTLAFVGASTASDAYNLYVDTPIAGTNATITRAWGIGSTGNLHIKTANSNSRFENTGTGTGGLEFVSNATASGSLTANYTTGEIALLANTSFFLGFYTNNARAMGITTAGNVSIDSTTSNTARLYVNQPVLASLWLPVVKGIPGNHTGLTTATEFSDFVFGGASGDANSAVSTRTATWLAGTTTLQRSIYFKGTILTGASATATFTNAYTLYVDPPTIGTNAAITRAWGIGTTGHIASIGTTNKIVIDIDSAGGAQLGMRAAAGPILQIGSVGVGGGGGYGNIDLMDNNGGVAYASFRPNSGGIASFAFGSSTLTNAVAYILGGAQSASWKPILRLDPGAHTGMTLSVEASNVIINTVTQQWATGALTTQRNLWFKSPTLAFVAASTVTDAYNLYLDAPLAGTNATLTGAWALGINGKLKFVTQPTNDNAATRILAVDPTTGEVKYRDSTSLGNTILTSTTVMTQSQVANSFSSPVTLLAAPGAGKFISIVGSVKFKYHFVTTAFTTGNNMVIQIGGNTISNQIAGTPLTIGADQYGSWGEVIWTGAASTLENGAVTFAFFTANPTGGGTSTVTITFEYIVKTL